MPESSHLSTLKKFTCADNATRETEGKENTSYCTQTGVQVYGKERTNIQLLYLKGETENTILGPDLQ